MRSKIKVQLQKRGIRFSDEAVGTGMTYSAFVDCIFKYLWACIEVAA
jgi:hypothetical protein